MTNRYIFAAGALLLASAGATAQDLNSEILVKHEIVPEERAATRLNILPAVSLPEVNPGRLPAASGVFSATLTPFISALEPAPYATAAHTWPWRGYAVLGYGPVYNLAASAGYRFVDTEKVKANIFMQFDGSDYKSDHPDKDYRVYGPVNLRNNSVTAGANTRWTPITSGEFTANVLYGFSAYNFPLPQLDKGRPTTVNGQFVVDHTDIDVNMLRLNAAWRHKSSGKIAYNVSAGYGLQRYGQIAGALTENSGKFAAGVTYDFGQKSHWGFNASASLFSTTIAGRSETYNKSVIDVHPYYLLTLRRFTARLGVKVDIQAGNLDSNDGIGGYIYPEVLLLWQPGSAFNLWGKADGHTDANSLASLYEAQPYIFPIFDNLKGYSHVYNFEVGTTLGPWKGASLQLFAGLDIAHKWLMPDYRAGYWGVRDVSGGHFGLKASYSFRQYLDLSAKLVFASSPKDDFEVGYYLWRDHARCDLNVSATIRPVDRLALTLGYHMRTHRAKPMPGDIFGDSSQNLGDIHDLSAGVSYQFNDRWGAFLRGENLINRRYYLGPAIPSQGIRGMIGVNCKF